jgi:cholesterol transport system auxiliary component
MKKRAAYAYSTGARALFLLYLSVLAGCTLPRPASPPAVYDFGPGALQTPPSTRIANLPPLELGTPHASVALASNAVLYRLAYVDAQQLKPYTQARWSMPPAQLISQRLREHLSQRLAVVAPGEIVLPRSPALAASTPAGNGAVPARETSQALLSLRLELEEFSQLFDAPDKSSGVLRLRATLTQRSSAGELLLAQRSFVAQQSAPTADSRGGVQALTAATDQVVSDIEVWLYQAAH